MSKLDIEGIATAAVMSYLGWLGSQAVAPSHPTQSVGRRVKGGHSSGSGSSGGTGMKPSVRSDLAIRPPNNTRMPRPMSAIRIGNQEFHRIVKVQSTITSSTTVIVETGFQFNLAQDPQNSSLTALFDQWCVVMASVSVASQLPPGSVSVPATLYSALDFDNNTALGSIPLIEDYSSCRVQVMQPTVVHTRSVTPCSKPTLSGTSSAGVQRSWIDSAQPSTPNYGIRVTIGITPVVQTFLVTTLIEFGLRNSI
jgi:hypothetical protein